jgi:RNA polymerase sigma factor (sigma-70 family)
MSRSEGNPRRVSAPFVEEGARQGRAEATAPSADVLFSHQRQLVARLAGRLGGGEAEDLASEAVARSLARPAPDGRQAPWVETIFRNLLADRGRRWARRGEPAPLSDRICQGGDTPEQLVLAAERSRAVAAALPRMPAELREAVEARFFAEQDYEAIAAGRGITPTTARTRVHRGLARLRRALAGVRAVWPAAPAVSAVAPAALIALLAVASPAAAPVDDGAPRSVVMRARPHGARPAIAANTAAGTTRPQQASPGTSVRHAKAATPASGDEPAAVKRMDFEEDEVEGALQRPGIMLIDGDPREKRLGSLIEIPRSFEPSMTKMIEDL